MQNGFSKYLSFYLLISGCGFLLGRILPKNWFAYHTVPFRTLPFEQEGKVYEQLGVKKWQQYLPDMSRIFPGLMPPKHMMGNYRERLPLMIQETCIAEFIHGALSLIGLLGLNMWDSPWRYLLTAAYILIFNLPYLIIQRYNRPRLVRIYHKLLKQQPCTPCFEEGVLSCQVSEPYC